MLTQKPQSHSPGAACPHRGVQWSQTRHINDFRRYSFLCRLLRMFGDANENGFRYKTERKGDILQIWMHHPASNKQEYASLRFNDEPEKVTADFRRIIHQIIFFTA